MKLTAFILLVAVMQISAKGYSQTVSISGQNLSLKKVFRDIQKQTGYNFLCTKEQLANSKKVDLDIKNAPIREILVQVFKDQPLAYNILSNTIIVKNKVLTQKEISLPPPIHITGTVTDSATGKPLAGVSIQIKGNTMGAITDANGHYSLDAPDDAVMIISYLGYSGKEISIDSRTTIDIALASAASGLNELVVTAMGITKSQASLSYASQQISGDDLTKVKTDNVVNALSGKVAGLTISPSASGIGGSAKVILRGNRSANGNNQPLYVIDGVPITNSGNSNDQQNSTFGGGPDGGDGIENINPNDIASISVLEGASAAALYGSEAQNGVILITTKKGKAGQTTIHYSSDFSVEHIAYKPKFQNSYGATNAGSTFSWGDPISGGHDNLGDYFQNGSNWTNAISLSTGSDKAETYFSFANTNAKGIQPGNTLKRNNFFVHETGHFLDNKLTVDGSVMYVNQKINNSPAIGFYLNPLTGLYLFPRGKDIAPYKQQYLFPDSTGSKRQNWIVSGDDMHQQNPWWVINRDPNSSVRNRIIMTGSVKYDFTNWLNLQVKGSMDRTADDYEYQRYSGTDILFNTNGNGNMKSDNQTITQKYGNILLNIADPNQEAKFQISGLLGASIKDEITKGLSLTGDLSTTDFFSTSNIIVGFPQATSYTVGASTPTYTHSQLQSLFANANLSYDNWAYLTLTGRNDWSSNLSFTPNESFFYPSAGLSLILSRMIHLPQVVSYAKLRGTFAQVGNTIPPYLTKVQNTQSGAGQLQINTAAPYSTLKPEKTNSFEVGTDWDFINDRLHFSFTYYKTNTHNQYVPVIPAVASLVSIGYVNAGNIQNEGISFTVGADIIKNHSFSWSTSINGSSNRNKIIDVDSKDSIDQFILTNDGNAYQSRLQKGGSYGDIYGKTFQRDGQGRIIFSGTGTNDDPYKPTTNPQFEYIGNPSPKFQLGWNNDLTYKNFNLHLLITGRFGGQVLSMTQMEMDMYGVTKETGDARSAGGVAVNGVDEKGNAVTNVDPQVWYSAIGGRSGISEAYIYSATVVRLREASLGYTFPINNSVFKDLRLSLIGRNLLYFYKKAPFDPELTMSTGNGLSGVDMFNQPATRYMGVSLNVTF